MRQVGSRADGHRQSAFTDVLTGGWVPGASAPHDRFRDDQLADVVQQRGLSQPCAPVVEIRWDLDLRALVNAGTYTLQGIRHRDTRIPLKQLATHVAANFI